MTVERTGHVLGPSNLNMVNDQKMTLGITQPRLLARETGGLSSVGVFPERVGEHDAADTVGRRPQRAGDAVGAASDDFTCGTLR
jgi:hypothetical protein